ncbi:MAG: cation transporter [Streptococcaceae bacterium]|jgi:copper chaperone|nr:cation transporter [Streptococcaceae bacterium]
MEKSVYKIKGMTCDHCVHHVSAALESVAGVKSAKVSLKKSEAAVKYEEPATVVDMQAAVSEAGYELVS